MLRVVKPSQTVFDYGNKVSIDNTVVTQQEIDEENAAFISYAQKKQAEEEAQRERIAQEVEREAEIRKAISDGVMRELGKRSKALDLERDRILAEAKKQAEKEVSEAKFAVMQFMDKAEMDVAKLKEMARKDGYRDGFISGKKESHQKCEIHIKATQKLLDEMAKKKENYFQKNVKDMQDMVFELVKKITLTELKTDPTIIEGIMTQVAKNFRNSDFVKISLAEGEISQKLKGNVDLLKSLIPFIPDIEIEILHEAEDNTLILDNKSEIIDASVNTQLEFVEDVIKTQGGVSQEEADFSDDVSENQT